MLPLDDVRGQEMPQIGKKWPKFGFFARGRRTRGGNLLQCINEMCARIRRFDSLVRNDAQWRHHLHFWEIMIFFQKLISRSKNNSRKLSMNITNRKKDALWSNFWIASILSVRRTTKSKLRNTIFFIKRVYFQNIQKIFERWIQL